MNKILEIVVLFLFFLATTAENGEHNAATRKKRYLLFPKGGSSRMQVITGFGIPVDLQRETVIIGTVIKGNYLLPTNISQIIDDPPFYDDAKKKKRKRRDARSSTTHFSRWTIYAQLAQITQMYGVGGKACILRVICDVARAPLDHTVGLFDEFLHLIFTPSSTKEALTSHADNEYFAAQSLGEKGGDCDAIFNECKLNLASIFSSV